MLTLDFKYKSIPFHFLIGLIACIVGLHILQDLIHAYYHHYNFYLSESLLFKASWILFIPSIYLFIRFLQNKKAKTIHLALAILLFSMVHIFSFALVVYAISGLFFYHTYNLSFIFKDTFAENFYLYVLIYTSIALLYKNLPIQKRKEKKLTSNIQVPLIPSTYQQNIAIPTGKKHVVVPVDEIYCICASSPYISIQTAHQQYLYSSSLKEIHTKLNPDSFIRIHKSTILNTQKVLSYQSRLNGDYDITLENQVVLRMSRNYAKSFKKYFSKSSA